MSCAFVSHHKLSTVKYKYGLLREKNSNTVEVNNFILISKEQPTWKKNLNSSAHNVINVGYLYNVALMFIPGYLGFVQHSHQSYCVGMDDLPCINDCPCYDRWGMRRLCGADCVSLLNVL